MLNRFVCICCLLAFCFITFNAKAQFGTITGFNTITLTKKNDLVFSVGKNFQQNSSDLSSYDVQAAYAFHPNIAAHIGYYSYVKPNSRVTARCETKNCPKETIFRAFNVAIGGFFKHDLRRPLFLQNKKRKYKYAHKNQLIFDLYACYGNNKNVHNYYTSVKPDLYFPNSTLKFDNYNLQSSLTWNGNFVGGSFSVKYGFLDFNKINVIGNIPNNVEDFIRSTNLKPTLPFYGLHTKFWVGTQQLKLAYCIYRYGFIDNESHFMHINNFSYVYMITKQLALQIKF